MFFTPGNKNLYPVTISAHSLKLAHYVTVWYNLNMKELITCPEVSSLFFYKHSIYIDTLLRKEQSLWKIKLEIKAF